ncbi:sulfatase-like hydrolase/transferase [Schnuerera ultunensis]|uniref:sulfatase-like hydrolase/transferase n=1 Tax=Schnuerera ultunensis TaxID=45497 RepID=UPI000425EDFD|nr:sulfatase-like hydrolase/transferase [Schnuerera ultunensis]
MWFAALLIWKILLFMDITKVEHNESLVLFTSTLIILFLFALIHFSNFKRKRTIEFSLYNIVSAFMFADVMYYSYFNSLPSIRMMKQFHQLGAVGDSVRALLDIKNLMFLLDIPFHMINHRKNPEVGESKTYNKYIRFGVPASIGLILVIVLSLLNFKGLMEPISNQELFTYHIKDFKTTLAEDEIAEGRGIFTQEDLEELIERSKLKEGEYTGIGKDKNLIVIQVEALQNFVINCFYEGQEITPNLNRLIREKGSLYFDNYYQQIGRGNTSDAEFVTNNSLYPSMEEPTYSQYEGNTFYGLPWILRDQGYTAWVFHGYEKEFWNRDKAYVNQGFQRFISEEDFDLIETIGFGITDEEFYSQSMDYLKELDSIDDNPFYAFIISLTSHTPFKMPEEYQYLDIKEEHEGTILGDYLQSIHYADKALGEFLEDLKEEGFYDNSVIAFYGDHFAITGFNPSGVELMEDFLNIEYDVNEMFKIPLIIHIPGEEVNETISRIGSQLDFLPTILNIMGYENGKGLMFGRDLANYEGENFVAAQTYVLKGSYIDDDTLFYMSNDGLFENSKALDRKTREPLDVKNFKERYENIISEINKSDYILKRDLIKLLMENQGQIDLAQLEGENIPDDKLIIKCYDNPLEQLRKSYEKGSRLLAVELHFRGNEEILLKGQQDMEDLVNWMEKHEEAYVILRSNEEDESIFLKVKEDCPTLKDRFIVEMTKFEQYNKLSNKAFKNIMLNISKGNYSRKEIMDFLKRHPLAGVIMDKKSAKKSFIKGLKNLNIPVYLDGVDKGLNTRRYKNIDGFFIGQ